MAAIPIAVINESTVRTDAQVRAAVPALQTQVTRDFGPAWGIDAKLAFVPKGSHPAPGSWWLVILDDSDQAGALGYHDLTSEDLPIGKIFAKTDLDNHLSWTVTASHELLEMLVDPEINLTVFLQIKGHNTLYAYEVCDACEDDQYAYEIDGTKVSDFVLPDYFQPVTGKHYDHGGFLRGPVPTLLTGGYISAFDVTSGAGWQQITAAGEGLPHRGHLRIPLIGSRANKRRRARDTWLRSTAHPPRLVPPFDSVPGGKNDSVDPNRLVPPFDSVVGGSNDSVDPNRLVPPFDSVPGGNDSVDPNRLVPPFDTGPGGL